MNGIARSIAAKMARILGTNTSVISWIWVSAWNSEITTPTTSPTTISGLDTRTSVTTVSRATSRTSGPVISYFLCVPRHCERSEAIQLFLCGSWIASLRSQ